MGHLPSDAGELLIVPEVPFQRSFNNIVLRRADLTGFIRLREPALA